MYAKLKFLPPTSNDDILNGLKAVLTGETVVDNIAVTSLDKPNSWIDITLSNAGWQLHDQVANVLVVKAPLVDDPTTFKYVRFYWSSDDFYMDMYDGWDNVAHTTSDTKWGNTYSTLHLNHDAAAGYITLRITASERHLAVSTCTAVAAESIGLASEYVGFVSEFTRDDMWNTVANGYHSTVMGQFAAANPTNPFVTNRYREYTGDDLLNGRMYYKTAFGTTNGTSLTNMFGNAASNFMVRNSSNVSVHPLYSFGCNYPPGRVLGGDLSGYTGMYFTTYAYGVEGDHIFLGAQKYELWETGDYRYAVKVG